MKARSSSILAAPPARSAQIQLLVLALCALSSLSALAFNSSLQPQEVEEAYSLGKTSNHEDLADFLNQYEHDFKYPADNSISYVSSVEFQTPYEQIVLRTLRTINYDKFQAEEDYQANPRLIIVRVIVSLKTGYTGTAPPADSFKVIVSQARPVEPQKVTSAVVCDPFNPVENSTFANCITYTREILLQFDVAQFAPGRATVRVMLPTEQPVETKYNLDKLK
jgi:hypothetical protein